MKKYKEQLIELGLTETQINSNGLLIYNGISLQDKKTNILVLVSGLLNPSVNDKTGAMAQADILVKDQHPIEAVKNKTDKAVCGSCPLRNNECYVNLGFGPSSKYKAWQRGNYPYATPEQLGHILKLRNINIRLGSYGDPAMVKYEIWRKLIDVSQQSFTSYTHQWNEPYFDKRILEFSMGSIDYTTTPEEFKKLYPTGRFYTIVNDYENLPSNTIACPSKSTDRLPNGQRKITCNTCNLCSGNTLKAKSIAIIENS